MQTPLTLAVARTQSKTTLFVASGLVGSNFTVKMSPLVVHPAGVPPVIVVAPPSKVLKAGLAFVKTALSANIFAEI